jgi:hypothetical protein
MAEQVRIPRISPKDFLVMNMRTLNLSKNYYFLPIYLKRIAIKGFLKINGLYPMYPGNYRGSTPCQVTDPRRTGGVNLTVTDPL